MSMDINEWVGVANEYEKGRDGSRPIFYHRAVEQTKQSLIEGRPVFKEVPFVRVLIPGQNKNIPDRPVTEEDKKRWAQEWEDFLRNKESKVSGTPLEAWPILSVARIAELKALNCHVVEQVRDAPDETLAKFGMDGRELQKRAAEFLSGDGEGEKALRTENAKLKRDIEDYKAQIRELKSPKHEE